MKKQFFLFVALLFSICSYSQTANDYYNRGASKFILNDIRGAIADFTKAIELNPKFQQAYFWRGELKCNYLADYIGAIADLTLSIELNPRDAGGYYYRGLSKGYLNDNRGAIADFTKALELNPNNEEAYKDRGFSKLVLKDNRGAIEDYNKAIELNPKFIQAYLGRGIAYYNSGQKDKGCLDLSKAGEMGSSKAYDIIKEICQ